MKKVLDIMKENRAGFLATIDGEKARVRPFEFQFEKEGVLYFCTANTKSVYHQMKTKPCVEWSVLTKEMAWVRVSGNAEFIQDVTIKAEILATNKLVASIYQSPENPIFEVFALRHGNASYADFSGNPEERFEW